MSQTCLNVELVEKFHLAILKGRALDSYVEGLTSATLAGILEFGCLRHSYPDQVPPIDGAVRASPIGLALSEVQSVLGTRADGSQRAPVRSLQARPVEFYVLATSDDLESSEWNNYCDRFERGTKQAGFPNNVAANLHMALFDMSENAVIHSQSATPALIGYEISPGIASFAVVDVGIGVLASLRLSQKYHHLQKDVDAVHLALRPGVSRFDHGGLGFDNIFKAIAQEWGQLRFRSGSGCIAMDGMGLELDRVTRSYPPGLPGFQVSVSCRTCAPNNAGANI